VQTGKRPLVVFAMHVTRDVTAV